MNSDNIILFDKVCIFNNETNKSFLYGSFKHRFQSVQIENINTFKVVFCNERDDFFIELDGFINHIKSITFITNNVIENFDNIELLFPFEHFDIELNKDKSAVISTFCKTYSHRLDEWIQYNLRLGFSGIVIFDNDNNKGNEINEGTEYCVNKLSIREICEKYKGKVFVVDFPYTPLSYMSHYDFIQRTTLHIGINALKNKCRHIATIDADEFIYLPENPKMNIETFLDNYKTITMRSNILTNKNDNDILDNNILDLAVYVGEDKYTKCILYTNNFQYGGWMVSPHYHPTETIMDKNKIIHYHAWMNKRYKYDISMPKIDFLQNI